MNAVDSITALREALTGLEQPGQKFPGLTPCETAICAMLRRRSPRIVRRDALCDALYALRPHGQVPADNIMKVFICKARRKLKPHGIQIITHWGIGYSMPEDSAAKWDEAIT